MGSRVYVDPSTFHLQAGLLCPFIKEFVVFDEILINSCKGKEF
jgi:hypothetical protein